LPEEVDVELVTSVPRWLFDCSLSRSFVYRELLHDPGLIQRDSVEFDPSATAKAWRKILADYPQLADREAERYKARSPLMVGDISPLAVLVAERLGAPSICVANFCWDWILGPAAERLSSLAEIASSIAGIYRRCGLLLRTPFHGDLSVFPRIRDIPLVVRRPTLSRQEAREHFNLPLDKPIVLLSFGGIGQAGVSQRILAKYPDILFVALGADFKAPNLHVLPSEIYHPNLVVASDIVFCKLGYGIVGEALACKRALLHLERRTFPETRIFEEQLPRYLHIRRISRADFEAGLWDGLYDLLAVQRDGPRLSPYTELDGGSEVAKILTRFAERGGVAWSDLL
jgi:L-arabinokinase